jgi:hypothetical protein
MWIKTAAKAVELLGGPSKVAEMFADVGPSAVSNWGKRGFPAKAAWVLAPKLKGHRFSPRLFNMLEPKRGGQNGRQAGR